MGRTSTKIQEAELTITAQEFYVMVRQSKPASADTLREDESLVRAVLIDHSIETRGLLPSEDGSRFIARRRRGIDDPDGLQRDLRGIGYDLKGPFPERRAYDFWNTGREPNQ
jgi:hypothetical protein